MAPQWAQLPQLLADRRVAGERPAIGFHPGEFRALREICGDLLLAGQSGERAWIVDATEDTSDEPVQRVALCGRRSPAVGPGEGHHHCQRRQGVVVVVQGTGITRQLVGQITISVDLRGGNAELIPGPIEQVLPIDRDRRRHHRPRGPVLMVVHLFERRVVPFRYHLFAQVAQPAINPFDPLRLRL